MAVRLRIGRDPLWFQHSNLGIVAKCIALAVMDLDEDNPRRMLSGEVFARAGIDGAVENDLFDWVIADAEGEALVRRIMAPSAASGYARRSRTFSRFFTITD